MTFSSSSQSDLIFQLDFHLRRVVEKPNRIDLEQFFHFLRQCHIERLNEEHRLNDDQLYIPSILLLRQFPKFTEPQLFDELLNEFLRLFDLIPICSKKILDDFLCLIGLMLSKKIVESHDEIQQKLFLKFFRSFLNATKINSKFFFDEFLGDFNRNLTIIGHFSSSLLQIFERVTSLDVRLEILECFSTIFSTKNVEEQKNRWTNSFVVSSGFFKNFGSKSRSCSSSFSGKISFLLDICSSRHRGKNFETERKFSTGTSRFVRRTRRKLVENR